MASNQQSPIGRLIAHLVEEHEYTQMTDRELLRRFTKKREEAAFLTLLQRHSTLIQRVCRRTLANAHDAEEVFQATFLVLLEKASALRWRGSIAGWLHEVAHRLALKKRNGYIRRGSMESQASLANSSDDPLNALTVNEAQTLLHEELNRLPERLRTPLVLCYLESATQEEAARQLGWSLRTVNRRLERGRTLLHQRLTRRGLTLAAALSTGLLTPAPAPASLIRATLAAALSYTSGKAGTIAAPVAVLVNGALGSMFLTKLKFMTVMAVCLVGTGLVLHQTWQKAWPGLRYSEAPDADSVSKNRKPDNKALDREESRVAVVDEPGKEKDEKPGVDLYGDPLPDGAIFRLGTIRYRDISPLNAIAISPNGGIFAGGA